MQRMVFSKHLDDLTFTRMGEQLAAAGIDQVDLTVRTGGHVDPERADHELPAAHAALGEQGVTVGMISTDIIDADTRATRRTLETAASLGIHHYKLGYWRYGGFGSLRRLRNEITAALKPLAAMNAELNLIAGFHNHSDDFFGACLADVADVLDSVDSPHLGAYFDPAHATIEGGSQGWQMGLERVINRLVMLAVKDFRWRDDRSGYAGARRHSVEMCPLAEGNTPWPQVLNHLQAVGFVGPTSFHSEYRTDHCFAYLNVSELIEQTRKDMEWFEQWQAAYPVAGSQALPGRGHTLR